VAVGGLLRRGRQLSCTLGASGISIARNDEVVCMLQDARHTVDGKAAKAVCTPSTPGTAVVGKVTE